MRLPGVAISLHPCVFSEPGAPVGATVNGGRNLGGEYQPDGNDVARSQVEKDAFSLSS